MILKRWFAVEKLTASRLYTLHFELSLIGNTRQDQSTIFFEEQQAAQFGLPITDFSLVDKLLVFSFESREIDEVSYQYPPGSEDLLIKGIKSEAVEAPELSRFNRRTRNEIHLESRNNKRGGYSPIRRVPYFDFVFSLGEDEYQEALALENNSVFSVKLEEIKDKERGFW